MLFTFTALHIVQQPQSLLQLLAEVAADLKDLYFGTHLSPQAAGLAVLSGSWHRASHSSGSVEDHVGI